MAAPRRALLGFLAAALSVLTFHQGMWALLHAAGLMPPAPFPTDPVPPLGVPRIASLCFWGGLYGPAFGPVPPGGAPAPRPWAKERGMPGHRDAWRGEADGSVAAEVGAFRLVVHAREDARGPVRFVVLRRQGGDGTHALVGSGTEADVRTAMAKAARMADRLAGPSRDGMRGAL